MKKVLVLACISVMLVSVVALVGCGGGDTGQAKQYMKQAEELATERGAKNTELLDAYKTVRQTTDPAAKATAMAQAETIYGEVQALVQKEIAEYKKIEGLKGVANYAKYAELKIQELTAFDEMLTATNDFLKKINNNEFTSQQELEAATKAYQAQATKLQKENDQARTEAEQLKKDKNL